MDTYEYEKYVTSIENVRNTLDMYGVAIIPNVLDENECSNIVNGIWNYFEHITQNWDAPLKRDDTKTWREIYKLFPLHSMLFQYFNIGHSQVCWDIRQNPKVVSIFAKIWNCKEEDLLVSFDGLSFSLPHEITQRGWNRNNTWYHTDQSYLRPDFECIQSWVTGLDVDKGDATLGFMEGSHKYHKEFCEYFDVESKDDWYKLESNENKFYTDKGCSYKKIYCPKGSMVLWDSRTIHCGVEAQKNREKMNTRAIVYVCYTPRRLASKLAISKRIKAFNELRTTSHWPHKVKLFAKMPRTYGNPVPEINIIDRPVLNELGMKLVGF